MENGEPVAQDTVTATVSLSGPDWELRTSVTVPKGPTAVRDLLPLAQSFADAVVDAAAKTEEDQGKKISCKKGCGACCRQMVPIAETEARQIRDLVASLPEPRRSDVRARFADARDRLEKAGLLAQLLGPDDLAAAEENHTFGMKYFAQGIACPFLEDESCSIHNDRPIACREYLVTSPAENCSRPTAETVQLVKLPLKIWPAIAHFDKVAPSAQSIRWVPLVLAPEWADSHPDDAPLRSGPSLLQDFFEHLKTAKRSIAD